MAGEQHGMCELGLKCPYFNHAIKTAQISATKNTDTGTDDVCTNLPLYVLLGMTTTPTPV
jgi:hypothetical protein